MQGYIDNRKRGFGYNNLDKLKYEVEGMMAKYEIAPNARYHALQVEGFTLDGDQDCMQASLLRSHLCHQYSHYEHSAA